MQQEGDRQLGSASQLALCLQSLLKDGRVTIWARAPQREDSDAMPLLRELDCVAREELALTLPDFSPEAALWGARLCYQLCRFVVCREIDENEIRATCAAKCPHRREAETDWSVDLTLRQLPRIFQLARHLSNGDPLLVAIRTVAAVWPLSSVGIPEVKDFSLKSFIRHPGLRRLYCDRIIAAADVSRLGDPGLDDVLRADLGLHHDLAPVLASKLFALHESH